MVLLTGTEQHVTLTTEWMSQHPEGRRLMMGFSFKCALSWRGAEGGGGGAEGGREHFSLDGVTNYQEHITVLALNNPLPGICQGLRHFSK